MEINRYLQRIGIHTSVDSLTLNTLHHLQQQHMLHIPFENLDVLNQVPITLVVEKFYEKIIENKRGGFCYELNGLFHSFLDKLGFKNHLIAATVIQPDGSWTQKNSHAAQIVELDQLYYVDVGFGDSVRTPLPLNGEEKEDVSGVYRAHQINHSQYDLQRKNEDQKWMTLLRFHIESKQLSDFKKACQFNQTSAESFFTQKELVSIATLDGRATLFDGTLTITKHKDKEKIMIDSHERNDILNKYFGIELDSAKKSQS